MTMRTRSGLVPAAALALGVVTLLATPRSEAQASLRVCSDPGNMPLSNSRGEGLENKMAAVLAKALGTTVTYYYRPGIERGLIRNTLDAEQCDVMLDMPVDSDDVLTTKALYRTTFVLVYRSDRGIHLKNLDDPQLKKLTVGVYETSAIREALTDHAAGKIQVHYLSHNADQESDYPRSPDPDACEGGANDPTAGSKDRKIRPRVTSKGRLAPARTESRAWRVPTPAKSTLESLR